MELLTKETNALGIGLTYEYDIHGRLIKETDGNGNATAYQYDVNGNCIKKTNAAGISVYFEYDVANRLTKVYTVTKAGEEYVIEYAYDSCGRVTETKDEQGNITRASYILWRNKIYL